MKAELLTNIKELEKNLRKLQKEIGKLRSTTISKREVSEQAEKIATFWVESIRSPMEHKFKLPKEIVDKYSARFKELHILSRPKTTKNRYQDCLKEILSHYKDELELFILQTQPLAPGDETLANLLQKIQEDEISDYLKEAFACAKYDLNKAAIVLGWCATIDIAQQKILRLGFPKFNSTSTLLKNQSSGRFKRFTKEFKVSTLSELQEIFDNDLIWMLEGLSLIDSNQSERLKTCFQYRNNSAHPGHANISKVHMHAFFTDVIEIVIGNPSFQT